jgi:transcriptional regulator with XRE-family HTH domain
MGSRIADQFGRNLQCCRRHAGLSQQELADLVELHRVDVSALERGHRLPRLDTILKVSAGVKASPCELLAGFRWLPGRYVEGTFSFEELGSDWAKRAQP